MAELDAQLRLDIDQALRDVDRLQGALDRAIAPIEIEVDDRQALELESTLREVERIAGRAATETAAIDINAGRAEANFEDLARALGVSEDAARRLTGELLEGQAAGNRLEDAARDIARQLGLSDREAERLAGSLREADRAADAIDVTSLTLAGRFAALRTSIGGIGTALAGIGGAAVLGAALVGANNAIQSFARLTDSINAVKVVFGEASGSVLAFGEDAARTAGLSQEAFNQAVAPIGAVLTNFGFNADEASKAAVTLIQRGADLASVYGGSVQDAVLAINSALVGQVEPLRRFGGEISQARVEAFALAEGLLQAGDEMDTATTVQARYGLILKDTAVVQNDFLNTSDDLANAQRSAAGALQNFVSDIGEALAPALETILVLVPEVVEGIRQLVPAFAAAGDSAAAFFESRGEGGGFREEGAALAGFFDVITAGGGIAANVGGVIAGMGRDVLNLDSSAQSTTAALERFNVVLEQPITRGIAQILARDLDKGKDAVTSFGKAIATTARSTTSFDTFTSSYRGFSDAANLSIPQLRTATVELIRNADALKLSAPEVTFLRVELALLNDLGRSDGPIRSVSERIREIPGAIDTTLTPLGDLRLAADTAGVALTEFALSGDVVATGLFNALDPADQLAIKLDAVATGAVNAGEAFADRLAPSLIDVSEALIDFNKNGKVSLNEFIRGLEDTFEATRDFRENMLAILAVSPEAFAELLELPPDTAANLVEQAVEQQRVPEFVAALVGDPQDLATEMSDIVFQAINIFRTEGPDAAEDFIVGVPLLFDDVELGRSIVAEARAGIERSRGDIGNLIESAFTQEDAANRAAGYTADVYDRQLLDRLGVSSFVNGDDIGALVEAAFSQPEAANAGAATTINSYIAGLNADLEATKQSLIGPIEAIFNIDLYPEGREARDTFIAGLSTASGGETGRLRQSILQTVNGAIQRQSPPKLFLDAGIDSGEAFWMGFEQADMSLRVPVPQMTGKISTSTAAATAGEGSGFTFAPTYVNTETKDLETVVARSEQLMGAVSGILNGRFKL